MTERIHLTGASGSGTTTLGRALAVELGWCVVDADDAYWSTKYTAKRDHAERLRMVLDVPPPFVLSGSIVGWGDELEDAFDLIVFLEAPTDVRLARLRVREPGAEDFYEYAAGYEDDDFWGRSRAKHEGWLAARSCPILRLDGTAPVSENLSRVLVSSS
jgi:adenylate kinase family enzyme